jgi:transposase
VKAQQKCLAHLRRHFKKLIKLPGLNNQEIGAFFISLVDEAFKNYALFPIVRTVFNHQRYN